MYIYGNVAHTTDLFTFHFELCSRRGLVSCEFNLTHVLWGDGFEQQYVGSAWNKKQLVLIQSQVIIIIMVNPIMFHDYTSS